MPFHLNIINSILHGVNQHAGVFTGFKAVFFADKPLVYPYLPDWHIAVLMGCGRYRRRRESRGRLPLPITNIALRAVLAHTPGRRLPVEGGGGVCSLACGTMHARCG
jgi:hypothetical protein